MNDIASALNNDNVVCGSFRFYPSYVAGFLHSVNEIYFFLLCTKMFDYTQYIESCITGKNCTFRILSKINFIRLPEEQHFELTYGGEKVTFFQTTLFPDLPSVLVFGESVLSRIMLSSLTYGIVNIDRHVTCLSK